MYWQDAYPDSVTDSTPAWLAIEQDLPKSSLPALLFSPNKPAKTITGNSFIVASSLRIWRQIKSKHNLPDFLTYTPICHNYTFPQSLKEITFAVWKNKGLATLADLYIYKTLATFTQLKDKYALPPSHFFRFLHARDYVRKNINFESLSIPTDLYALLSGTCDLRETDLLFCRHFHSLRTCPLSIPKGSLGGSPWHYNQ